MVVNNCNEKDQAIVTIDVLFTAGMEDKANGSADTKRYYFKLVKDIV